MRLTSDDIAYLRMAASRDHYNPDDALKVFNYESSGRPDVWGGKGGKYFGIFQAGPSERAQFGIDTNNPSAKNQIDAFGKFLAARGYKPGMGLLDLYSTVNAGSPGHYQASDGNGTVASHVAKMMGTNPSLPASTATPNAMPVASAPMAAPTLSSVLNSPQAQKFAAGLLSEGQGAQAQPDEFQQEIQQFHQRAHQAALQGLLGGSR
jgi:hypothetical protein